MQKIGFILQFIRILDDDQLSIAKKHLVSKGNY